MAIVLFTPMRQLPVTSFTIRAAILSAHHQSFRLSYFNSRLMCAIATTDWTLTAMARPILTVSLHERSADDRASSR